MKLILVFILGLFVTAPSLAQESEDARLVAATFRSNWCGACHVLEPKIAKVKPAFLEQPVEFITFDFSFGQRRGLADRAAEEGILDAYEAYAGRTGFMLLLDRETGDILTQITMRQSEDQIADAIDRALTITRRRDEFDL